MIAPYIISTIELSNLAQLAALIECILLLVVVQFAVAAIDER
jgi:hypothetical protein